jgi:hypothetical protein
VQNLLSDHRQSQGNGARIVSLSIGLATAFTVKINLLAILECNFEGNPSQEWFCPKSRVSIASATRTIGAKTRGNFFRPLQPAQPDSITCLSHHSTRKQVFVSIAGHVRLIFAIFGPLGELGPKRRSR